MSEGNFKEQRVWKWKSDNRYYVIRLQQDLFDGWSLFKEWGSMRNRAGRLVCCTYGRYDEALMEVQMINDKRRKRGYKLGS